MTTTFKIDVSEIIEAPAGSKLHIAPVGTAAGFELPDGRIIKPWIVYEIEEGDSCRNLTHDEMLALGITQDIDFQRNVEEV